MGAQTQWDTPTHVSPTLQQSQGTSSLFRKLKRESIPQLRLSYQLLFQDKKVADGESPFLTDGSVEKLRATGVGGPPNVPSLQ